MLVAMFAVYDPILPIFLFGLFFSFVCLSLYTPKSSLTVLSSSPARMRLSASHELLTDGEDRSSQSKFNLQENNLIGEFSGELTGQLYRLACDLADAPTDSLKGQSYQLACRFSDIPQTYLQGQSYYLTCDLADVPESSLQGQYYSFASILKPTWHSFYQSNLGRSNVDYWQWRSYPEVKNVCLELTLLIDLPMPKKYDQEILESLAAGTNLFLFDSNGGRFDFNAKFARRSPQSQQKMRQSFKRWHETACNLLGQETMQAIYRVCYRTDWAKIAALTQNSGDFKIVDRASWWQVLGVAKTANSMEVELAYKKLIRMWHPDLNSHPDATKITALINIAYEKYRTIELSAQVRDDRDRKRNDKIARKFQEWLEKIFPH
jgi:hypothetical protein